MGDVLAGRLAVHFLTHKEAYTIQEFRHLEVFLRPRITALLPPGFI